MTTSSYASYTILLSHIELVSTRVIGVFAMGLAWFIFMKQIKISKEQIKLSERIFKVETLRDGLFNMVVVAYKHTNIEGNKAFDKLFKLYEDTLNERKP